VYAPGATPNNYAQASPIDLQNIAANLFIPPPAGSYNEQPDPFNAEQSQGDPALIHQLVVLAAFCKELELQAHLVHLNYTGPDFLPLHQFLKTQYQLHQEQFDTLAEFVRTQGAFLPTTNAGLRAALPQFSEPESPDPLAMVAIYAENLAQQAQMARNLDQSAATERAIDVQNYAAELVAAANKAIWFLSASR
jgi:DNA-binding ferritin-like protein